MKPLKLTRIIQRWLNIKHGIDFEKMRVIPSKFVREAVDGRADSIHIECYGMIRIYLGKRKRSRLFPDRAPWNKLVTVYRVGSEMPLYINPSEPDFFKQIEDYLEL